VRVRRRDPNGIRSARKPLPSSVDSGQPNPIDFLARTLSEAGSNRPRRLASRLAVLGGLTVLVGLLFWHSRWSDPGLALMRTALNLAGHGEARFNLGDPGMSWPEPLWLGLIAAGCAAGIPVFTVVAALASGFTGVAFWLLWRCQLAAYRHAGPSPSRWVVGVRCGVVAAGLLGFADFRWAVTSGLGYPLGFALAALLAWILAARESRWGDGWIWVSAGALVFGAALLVGAGHPASGSTGVAIWLVALGLTDHRRVPTLAVIGVMAAAVVGGRLIRSANIPSPGDRDPEVMRGLARLDLHRWTAESARPSYRRIATISLRPGYDGLRLGPSHRVVAWRDLADPSVTGTDAYRPLEIAGAAATDGRAELNNAGRRWPIATAGAGQLELELRFDRADPGVVEPICSLGDPVSGWQCMVRFEANGGVHFLFRRGDAVRCSRLVARLDFRRDHLWVLDWRPFPMDASGLGRVRLRLDGVEVADWTGPVRAFRDEEVLVGWNTQADDECLSRFGGRIVAVGSKRGAPRGADDYRPGPGQLLQVRLNFSEPVGGAEPLLAIGGPGAGPLIWLRRPAPGSIEFGAFGSVGTPAVAGPLAVDDRVEHTVEVALGAWLEHGPTPMRADQVRVSVDGVLALATNVDWPSFRPDQVYLLENPFGVPGCAQDFTGGASGVRTIDAAERAAGRRDRLTRSTGPVTADLQFNGPTLGSGLGLLETGVPGAGDILSVVMIDRTHVRFSFDHWGVGGVVGPVVAIDPRRVYRCRIEIASLEPDRPSDRPTPVSPVRVRLDDRVVLSGESACHPARPDQVYFMANALKSSGVSAPFDGTCVNVERGR